MDSKVCTKCKQNKPKTLEFYPPHNKKRDGLDSWCRKCRASYRSEINRGKFRGQLTDEEVKLLKKQKHCDICGSEDLGKNKNHKHVGKLNSLVMDHDHMTGKFRGMLCNLCNRALGNFKDDIKIISNAIEYLNKSLRKWDC